MMHGVIVAQSIEAHFSPGGNPTSAIIRELDGARHSVLVQAYSFTTAPIAKALKDARDRGVKVGVLLDKSQRNDRYSIYTYLRHAKGPAWIGAKHAIAHNKVIVIDETTMVTGSFNFTKAAQEKNAENLLVVRDKKMAKQYTANWWRHRDHSD
jgi:phosphatidylserine/phosphatidylglycerophosphate/cardiolipin synthase-like enzyme